MEVPTFHVLIVTSLLHFQSHIQFYFPLSYAVNCSSDFAECIFRLYQLSQQVMYFKH